MVLTSGKEDVSPVDEFLNEVNLEIDQTARSLKDIGMMLDQSQNELNKLSQKNSQISSQLQKTQSNIDLFLGQKFAPCMRALLMHNKDYL